MEQADGCVPAFFEHITAIVVLVLFTGRMSGCTLGLMSLSLVGLEVLAMSGTEKGLEVLAMSGTEKGHKHACTSSVDFPSRDPRPRGTSVPASGRLGHTQISIGLDILSSSVRVLVQLTNS